jgi:hypothetical protein
MEATDLRDKIHALLGYLDRELSDPMHADYSLQPATVYCKFKKRKICDKGNLEAIRVCQLDSEARFSSWALGPYCVDWTVFCHLVPA